MEQHPIPQNISSYEFRLVGDMTLKQFFQLAGGMLVAFLIYKTPLIGLVKYPLMIISVLIGVVMAFIPINGRPFGRWIVAFLRAIYSPTQFTWSPPTSPAVVLTREDTSSPNTTTVQAQFVAPASASTTTTQETPAQTAPISVSPDLTTTLSNDEAQEAKTSKPQSDSRAPISDPKVVLNSTTLTSPSDPKQPIPSPVEAQFKAASTPSLQNDQTPNTKSSTSDEQTIFINMKTKPEAPTQDLKKEIMQPVANNMTQTSNNLAQITSQIATPTRPNVLTGIAVNKDAKPLDGVIIEIIDSATGIPSRALRTNRTGIFQIVTPLSSGTYTILAEKEGLSFDPINVEAKNDIIQPIILTSK